MAFRRHILTLASVEVLDLIEKRNDVFLDAIQDACFVVFRRREDPATAETSTAASGVLHACGSFEERRRADIRIGGDAWVLPGQDAGTTDGATLAELGYRATVGYLVANRQPRRMHTRAARGRLPLVWAACVAPDGRFDFNRGRKSRQAAGKGFVDIPEGARYAVRTRCVIVQRTSSKSQARRIFAAPVPAEFIARFGGVVGENHVILLVPTRDDAIAPEELAIILNRAESSAAMARVSGSASLSTKLLSRIQFPSQGNPP